MSTVIQIENDIINALINSAINNGLSVTINDSEEDVVVKSTDFNEIKASMRSTDEEYMLFYDKGVFCGSVFLVYGNTGWDVIADTGIHTGYDYILSRAEEIANAFELAS